MISSRQLFLILFIFPQLAGCDAFFETEEELKNSDPVFEITHVTPADKDTDVVLNPLVRIKFSQHLNMQSVSTENYYLRSGAISKWLMSYYNPVEKELVLWVSSSLRQNAVWELGVVGSIYDEFGHELEPEVLSFFMTGNRAETEQPFGNVSYSLEIEPMFKSKCGSCHDASNGFSGLDISCAKGLQTTAINRVSMGWPSMMLIEPRRPGASYLLRKLLNDSNISGLTMPRDSDTEGSPLSKKEKQLISDWIAGGANF